MSNKNKLKRFADVAEFENVYEPNLAQVIDANNGGAILPHPMRGKWASDFFGNNNKVVLELACGGGEYTVALAKQNPDINFLGVDIKGARLWKGAGIAIENGLSNAGFLRTRIDFITSFFEAEEIDEAWITFPDPQPQKNRARKRLTAPMFIDRYKQFFKKGALIHLKHDNDFFFNYTLEQIEECGYELVFCSHDIYADLDKVEDEKLREILQVKTYYEEKFAAVGHVIKYLSFRVN